MPHLIDKAKRLAKSTIPYLFFAIKRRRKAWQFRRAHGGAEYRAKSALVRQYGQVVLGGPFKGMRYGDDVACSAYVAKLVGSYEEELHGAIKRIIERRYTTVVDIGCAEGYYAVGLAMRLPNARVVAFDTDVDARRFCADLARMNNVHERIEVRGECDHIELSQVSSENTIVVCDCEGFEEQLLVPAQVPGLAETDVLVELHEFLSRGLTERVISRFKATHEVTLIDTQERDIRSYPILQVVEIDDRPWAVREGRPASMQWAFLKARCTIPKGQ
jgi:hypothetical protein